MSAKVYGVVLAHHSFNVDVDAVPERTHMKSRSMAEELAAIIMRAQPGAIAAVAELGADGFAVEGVPVAAWIASRGASE